MTIPSESPTRIMSTPAASTSVANVASYAVIIAIRSPAAFIAVMAGTVIVRRGGGGSVVIGLLKAGLRSLDGGPAPRDANAPPLSVVPWAPGLGHGGPRT